MNRKRDLYLDLSAVVQNPTPLGLKVLQRLTGVDMGDLLEELEPPRPRAGDGSYNAFAAEILSAFRRQRLADRPGKMTGATTLYNDFRRWFERRYQDEEEAPPAPSQRRFGKWMRREGYMPLRMREGYVYCGVALKD